MSTWTSSARRVAVAALALAALTGCFENAALSRAVTRASGPSVQGSVGVLDGAITVAGPEGYCVDAQATRETDQQAFVLLVRCRGDRDHPVLSVTVTDLRVPGGDPAVQLSDLTSFVLSGAGRGQLSRRGRASDVTIAQHRITDGALWLNLSDAGNPAAFEPGYWRVVMPLAGRLVTLSALSLAEAPSDGAALEGALASLVGVLRRRNLD